MKTSNNDLFSIANHFIGRLGLVTTLLDGIIERITPKEVAQACSGTFCGNFCGACCANCSGDYLSTITAYYSYDSSGCAQGHYTCTSYVGCDYC